MFFPFFSFDISNITNSGTSTYNSGEHEPKHQSDPKQVIDEFWIATSRELSLLLFPIDVHQNIEKMKSNFSLIRNYFRDFLKF